MCNESSEWCVAIMIPLEDGESVGQCPACDMEWNKANYHDDGPFSDDDAPHLVLVCARCGLAFVWRFRGSCEVTQEQQVEAIGAMPLEVKNFIGYTQATIRGAHDCAYGMDRKAEIQQARRELKMEALKKNARNN